MTQRVTTSEKQRMVALYANGMTAPEVAAHVGRGVSSVYRAVKSEGIIPSSLERRGSRGGANRRFTDDEEADIADVYQDGLSMSSIAIEHGCSLVTIRNALRRQGVSRRRRGNSIRSFSDTAAKGIVDRYIDGESRTSIAAFYETHVTIVDRVLAQAGVEILPGCNRREKHGNWKGGRHTYNGYVSVILDSSSPFTSMRNIHGYVLEHRLVVAKELGRSLESYETVHHVNGVKDDNSIDNLQLRSGNHGKGVIHRCVDCGSTNIVMVKA